MVDDAYSRDAERFFENYMRLDFNEVHRSWLPHLQTEPRAALDVGAGSGRDALALAERGWEVLAAEPADKLRELGQKATGGYSVQWLDDQLPELNRVRALSERFDLILVSAVWMHVAPTQRDRAFRILSDLLAPGGLLVITLRHGPGDGDRTFFETSREELERLARDRALAVVEATADQDATRSEVQWETLVFRLPDDGTGALPLLRHIIVNDRKTSTYKLGLLRSIVRIAEGLPGTVIERNDDWVAIPFGLVGLYWLKLYRPLLLQYRLPQVQARGNPGFATEAFRQLAQIAPMELNVGRSLEPDTSVAVMQAIRDACKTIAKMPAHYTTHPGNEQPVFRTDLRSFKNKRTQTRLDTPTLQRFGTFHVPTALWDCCSRYACWLEPAIINEWAGLIQQYERSQTRAGYQEALIWGEAQHDTRAVRTLVNQYRRDTNIRCVWTASALKRRFAIDHCFPWSRCGNNDLWNLMPTTPRANNAKGDRLPAAELLHYARDRILAWWEQAFAATAYRDQFFIEAAAALPAMNQSWDTEAVFEGVLHQRRRVRMNQQLPEWPGLKKS